MQRSQSLSHDYKYMKISDLITEKYDNNHDFIFDGNNLHSC